MKFYALSPHHSEQWTDFSHNSVTDLTLGFDEIILHVSAYNSFYIQLTFFVIWAAPLKHPHSGVLILINCWKIDDSGLYYNTILIYMAG